MKKLITAVVIIAAGLTIASDDDALRMLQLTNDEANTYIRESLWYGILRYPFTIVHKLEAEHRADILRGMFRYGRKALSDTSFLRAYTEYRASKMPQQPDPPRSGADFHREQIETLRQQLRETETQLKTSSAEERDVYMSLVSALRDALRQAESRPATDMASLDEALKSQYDQQMKEYRDSLARFEITYPSDPTILLRRRLQEYLEMIQTVDFDAVTRRISGNVRIFENPRYEDKPPMWKLCYRAGRDLNMIAVHEAKAWLAELDR